MGKTIGQWTDEIREINIEKGWRPAGGGPGDNTWGDYVSLLHSEISEALEAFRDHGLADATTSQSWHGDARVTPVKPEGVGSELADVFIRLVDHCDASGVKVFDMDMEIGDVSSAAVPYDARTFGDHLAVLHEAVSELWVTRRWATGEAFPPAVLRTLVTVARKFGIDLEAEVERKVAFNRTRAFQHGGRTLAPKTAAVEKVSVREELSGAIPTDPRDWWTGDEVDAFIETWQRIGLPEIKMADANSEVLVLWTADQHEAARMLDAGLYVADEGFLISEGAYTVCVLQIK